MGAICDYAPTSDLCAQERQREALKPKAKGDKGKGPAMAIAKPVAKPAPPPVKLTKEAQAVADAEATIAKMESAVKDYDSSVPRMKAKLPQMKEVRDKKAKKDKFVAQNKARREEKERDERAKVKA